ncbi:MAG: hypothetical protein IJW19_03950 [Clostridia bacterium]|nr:hypothetical protein [Clostridia bacterium]
MAKKTEAGKRKWYFKALKKVMKIRYKKPEFIYLDGENIKEGSIILSNHEGTDAPMAFEIYHNSKFRMWGAHEMNSGLIELYKYQTKVYYHEKKHWNIHLARVFCLVASPLTNLFYSGLNLISTYKDNRFVKTVKESYNTLKNGENIIIYPEDSTNGYLAELEGFHAGFALLCEYCSRKGLDVPIYVTYFKKKENIYIIDKPVMYSELSARENSKEKIAKALCDRCNELGKMSFDSLSKDTECENEPVDAEEQVSVEG